ncbi:molybdate ABC transporter substrate-binding protein [Mucilaginibacter sp. Bleaf8]|uniref:molybdate ABC transporter substrate-binding protein n=1 Tax=Mucilaginibacter sp. Bleaf8 TaxID=2834430 RepID=UPI001BCB06FC|nr:molybdate ABC transporter substrate-binding protein [Mucilaginibacter sp. Bleaf8]MBS7566226.1 molybdate ABC transporter substrate-binding protein [Mucilaginibacter sp. Bleaf8]
MKRVLILLTAFALPIATMAQRVFVGVAANAEPVAKKLAKEFKKETGIKAELYVSSSGKLTTQIEQGAPLDIFLSADMKYPQELYAKKLTLNKPRVYANGSLIMWSRKGISVDNGLQSLTAPAVQKIAVANPALAPYGSAAIAAIKKAKLATKLQAKLVYGESISQVNQYLLTGAADVAFTAKSVVLDLDKKNKGDWKEVDPKLYPPIAQGVVMLKAADTNKNKANTQKFYDFLFSRKGKSIFAVYGYKVGL